MRFMMIMVPKGYEQAEPGTIPDAKAVAAMMKYTKRCPASDSKVIEIRQVLEFADFPADVQKAAGGYPEMQAQPGRLSQQKS